MKLPRYVAAGLLPTRCAKNQDRFRIAARNESCRQGTPAESLWFEGMPRFYRHIRSGDQLIEDPEGIELPDLASARAEALYGIRDLLADAIRHGKDDLLDDAIVIMDEAGRELMTIPFIEGLPPRLFEAVLALPSTSKLGSDT